MQIAQTSRTQVAVGMSGGVDSTMAAWLLKRQGYDVVGLTMQTWDGALPLKDEGLSGCFGPGEARDIEAARAQAARLGIPHTVIPLAREFAAEVLDDFRREYRAGRTPNPCMRCNRAMKFGLLLERARAQGICFDFFATGHYARVERDKVSGRCRLLRGVDRAKDQSYFLSGLSQDQLRQALFPLGALTKQEVKALAHDIGWVDLAKKKESQNFIECKDYGVLFGADADRPGPIVDLRGRVVGEHRGVVRYTVGQRKGVGLSGTKEPLYVVQVDAVANTVTVGGRADILGRRLRAEDLNWISLERTPVGALCIQARIRQQHKEADAKLTPAAADSGASVVVTFDEPQMAITPGQTVVFYQGDVVIGSGIIAEAIP